MLVHGSSETGGILVGFEVGEICVMQCEGQRVISKRERSCEDDDIE